MATAAWQSPPSDVAVVERVCSGEVSLYELLMRRYNQRLFRVIRSIITDDSEAEDVLQDAWVRAFEHLKQFEGRSAFATWLTKIALHEALARARLRKRLVALEDFDGETMAEAERVSVMAGDPEKQAAQGELRRLLRGAVDRLPAHYRTVFMLRAVEQMSTSETADCLSLSEEAVKTRLHRARSLLRSDLEDRFGPSLVESYSFLGQRCDLTVKAVMNRISQPREL